MSEYEQLIGIDEDGYFSLLLDYEGNEEIFKVFFRWENDACEHLRMTYASEHISNWSGYRYFQEALADVGWDNFPTLKQELPQSNGGATTSNSAKFMLQELALFRQLADDRQIPSLIDTSNGKVLYTYIEAYDGVFSWNSKNNLRLGIDADGFFIEEHYPDYPNNRRLYVSKRFEQRILEHHDNGRVKQVEFYDADTEERFISSSAVSRSYFELADGERKTEYPRLLHVENRQIDASEYDYQLTALEKICRASIKTTNPIIWC
ncbi:MAG: hypothetical protein AAFV93_00440 [Chloroflexota bacterium]